MPTKEIMQQRSRNLRCQQTDSELVLWQALRNRQLLNCKFRRQVVIGNYIVDFLCVEKKLVIELDGSQHELQLAYDNERTLFLEKLGYTIVRYHCDLVLREGDAVLEDILGYLD